MKIYEIDISKYPTVSKNYSTAERFCQDVENQIEQLKSMNRVLFRLKHLQPDTVWQKSMNKHDKLIQKNSKFSRIVYQTNRKWDRNISSLSQRYGITDK